MQIELVHNVDERLILAIDLVMKCTLVLGSAAIFTRMFQKASAAVRHRIWACAFLVCACLPAMSTVSSEQLSLLEFTTVLQSSTAPIIAHSVDELNHFDAHAIPDDSDSGIQINSSNSPSTVDSQVRRRLVLPGLVDCVFIGWGLGTILLFGQLVHSFRQNLRLQTDGAIVDDELLKTKLDAICDEFAITKRVKLLRSNENIVPMSWGWRRPIVLLPVETSRWSEKQTATILKHELAHVRRDDWCVQILAYGCCAIFWFHPIVWFAYRKLKLEQEFACDDLVLASGVRASDYATQLVLIAEQHLFPKLNTVVTIASGPLQLRVEQLLSPIGRRNEVGRVGQFAFAVTFLLAILTFLSVRSVSGNVVNRDVKATNNSQDIDQRAKLPADVEAAPLSLEERDAIALNNFKLVMRAIHAYVHDHDGELPPAVVPNDLLPPEKRLSGFVLLLPYLEIGGQSLTIPEGKHGSSINTGQELFNQLDLTKAWDDPANAEGAKTVIPQFLLPFGASLQDSNGYANTHIAFVRGSSGLDNGCFPNENRSVHILHDIPDGTVFTIAIGQVHENVGPWIAAGSSTSRWLIAHSENRLQSLSFSSDADQAAYFATMDGYSFFLDLKATPAETLRRLAAANDRRLIQVPESRYQSREEWSRDQNF